MPRVYDPQARRGLVDVPQGREDVEVVAAGVAENEEWPVFDERLQEPCLLYGQSLSHLSNGERNGGETVADRAMNFEESGLRGDIRFDRRSHHGSIPRAEGIACLFDERVEVRGHDAATGAEGGGEKAVPSVRAAAKHAQQRPGRVDSEVLEKDIRDDLGAKGYECSLDVARQFRRQRQWLQDRSDQTGDQSRGQRKTGRRRRRDSRADEERRLAAADDLLPIRLTDHRTGTVIRRRCGAPAHGDE
jgi:hypothetical protein